MQLAGPPVSGAYLDELMGEAERLGVRAQIEYHGVLSRQKAIALQQSASIGLVPYLPVANSQASMANKLLEGMALGLAMVFSDFPNYRQVAGVTGAGIAVDPTRPEEIAAAIDRLVRQPELARRMGEAGRRAVRERFNWSRERAKLLHLYEELLSSGARATGRSGYCQRGQTSALSR